MAQAAPRGRRSAAVNPFGPASRLTEQLLRCHDAVQTALPYGRIRRGWIDLHLHSFKIGEREYTNACEELDELEMLAEGGAQNALLRVLPRGALLGCEVPLGQH